MSNNLSKPKYIKDLQDELYGLDFKIDLLDEIIVNGYEYTFRRWGGERRKTDYFLWQFQKASQKAIEEARNDLCSERSKLRRKMNG